MRTNTEFVYLTRIHYLIYRQKFKDFMEKSSNYISIGLVGYKFSIELDAGVLDLLYKQHSYVCNKLSKKIHRINEGQQID